MPCNFIEIDYIQHKVLKTYCGFEHYHEKYFLTHYHLPEEE